MVSWWWLICHDRMSKHPHFLAIVIVWIACFFFAWWLFLLAYRDMREGWEKNRFLEWQGHWRDWVLSVERKKTQEEGV